ncbi:MAG: hypothetical protein FWC26_01240, partial [Fibromonadales bacterium]|nr:hypothetical protein [Fibromonadales bacterium]
LHQVLAGLINYDGFATNSKGESDDKTSLNGNPNVSLQYPLATSHSPLSKRVETTQKATATIITDNVSADNYALARTNIVIMETVEEEDFVKKIACFRGNYCTTLDEDVCSFINGEEVSNCTTLRKFCFINNGPCVANMLVSECAGIGGTVAKTDEQGTCQAVPILPTIHSPLATSHLPKYYTLHGQPLGTQKPSTPGIYIEKAGYQARKIMVK